MRAVLLFWAKLVFCYMELLKYCRNVANVKTFGIMKLFQRTAIHI